MPFISDPRGRSWDQLAKDLRHIQAVVDLFKKRFEAAGQNEVAEKLEGCILAFDISRRSREDARPRRSMIRSRANRHRHDGLRRWSVAPLRSSK
jgi:hypothetical protein